MFQPKETRGSAAFQSMMVLILALLASVVSGSVAAISALAGGVIVILAGLLAAWIVDFGVRRKSASAFMALLLAAEIAKLFFVFAALMLVWLTFRQVSWLWEILGCIVAFAAYGLKLLINSRRR
jgi:F0F1-type ATP synthase assembly protein I